MSNAMFNSVLRRCLRRFFLGPTNRLRRLRSRRFHVCLEELESRLVPAALVGWWRGEGNTLDSAGGNNGTISGGVTFAPGVVGQAFLADGIDGTIDVGNAPGLQLSSGDFTVGAWVNFASLTEPAGSTSTAPAGDMSLVDKMVNYGSQPNTDGWRLIKQDDNHFWFGFGGGAGVNGLTGGPTTVHSQTTVTTGQWYYVVGVKSTNGFAIYVNGALEATKPLAGFTDSNSANLLLGSNIAEGSYLNGLLDEATLYNGALSASEIAAMYSAGLTGDDFPGITTPSLPNWTLNQPDYSQSISAVGGTGPLKFSATGTLPPGLNLTSAGVLSGTPTSSGTYAFTVTATDSAGNSTSQSYAITVGPGAFSEYLVTVLGSTTVQAGSAVLTTVQAADAYGIALTSGYSGPATVTASITPTSAASNLPISVPISASGLGFFNAIVGKAGSYTITVSSGAFTGSTSSLLTVIAGPADKLAFAVQPVNTPTGVALPPVTVQILDGYGNVVTSDNSDTVTVAIGTGPGSFTAGSTTTATIHNGVATFNNLALAVPGSYSLSAIVPGLYTGPNSAPFTILPLQIVPGSFVGTPSGFSLQLNAPILINSMTPALFGSGSGSGATVRPTVTLTQTSGTAPAGSSLPYQVPGSLIVNTATNTLTFVETDTASVVNNGTPLLPDGVYVVHIASSGANGLQALNSGGGFLDGANSGTPGHDFTATFTVGAAAANEDVLWVPATADGPGQALSAPGMNRGGGGYPVYLSDKSGTVTDIQATLSYDPSLLSVTPRSTATFTVTVPKAGTAVLHYSGPALAAGSQAPIGFLTATVPAGTASNPVPYKAKDLLQVSGVSLDGGALTAEGSSALHLVAFVGDADGNGLYSSNDALLITRVNLQADTGFAAFPSVDPVIVADTDGSGFIPADAALQVNEAGVGVPTMTLPVPPIPAGVHFQARVLSEHAAELSTAGSMVARVVATSNTNQISSRSPAPASMWFIPHRHRKGISFVLGTIGAIDSAALDL